MWLKIKINKKRHSSGIRPSWLYLILKYQILSKTFIEYWVISTVWKMSKYGAFCGSHFPVFYSVNLRIQSEHRKIRTRENSVFGHVSRSVQERCNQNPFKDIRRSFMQKRPPVLFLGNINLLKSATEIPEKGVVYIQS